jgi:hypothetical protein
MSKKKKSGSKGKTTSLSEPQVDYGNRISITTFEALEERDREHTRKMTHNQRMEYLQKLISITHSEDDLKRLEKKFYEGKIMTRKVE